MIIENRFFPNHLLKSELLRSATLLISGTVAAQLISIILRPLLARFFSPESFGIYSVYVSLVGMIIVLSSLRYDDTIVLPKSDKESINLLGLALILNFLFNIIIFILVLLLGKKIISFLNLPGNFPVPILYIIPLGALLFGTYQSLNTWLIRKRKFKSVSVNKLARRSSEGIAQMSFAWFKSFNGLIFSDIIGQACNVVITAYQSKKNGLDLHLLSFTKLRYVFHKYSEFPRYNLIPAFMSTCSYALPPIFITKFFSPESAGYFDFSKLLLSLPLALVASSLSSVLLQRISERFNRKESFLAELKPVFFTVGLISVVEIVLIILFGESIFTIIFGKQYSMSGTISKIMVWSFASNFVVATFSSIFVSMRKIKIYSIWQLIYFLAIISLLFFKHLPFTGFIKVYVLIEVLCYFIVAVIMFLMVYRYETSVRMI